MGDGSVGDGSVGDGSVGDGSVGDGSVGDGSVGDGRETSTRDGAEGRRACAEARRAGKPKRPKRATRPNDAGTGRPKKRRADTANAPAFLGSARARAEPDEGDGQDAQEVNPYAPPKKKPRRRKQRRGKRKRYTAAASRLRFVNFAVDGLAIGAISFALGLFFVLLGVDWTDDLATIVGYPIYILYYLIFEALFGRTPGKLVTGTMVVDDEGQTPGFGAIIKRTLCRHVPFDALSFFGEGAYGWHDRWSGTHVVLRKRR